jgi:hypothetical protein
MPTPQFSFRARPETVTAIDELQAMLTAKRGGAVSKAEAIDFAVLRTVEELKAGGAVDRMTAAKLQGIIDRERAKAVQEVLRRSQEHWELFVKSCTPAPAKTGRSDKPGPAIKRMVVGRPDKPEIPVVGIGGSLAQVADRRVAPSALDEDRKMAVKRTIEALTKTAEAAEAAEAAKGSADTAPAAPASTAEVAAGLLKSRR